MGKGSSSRPFVVSNEEYKNRWDAIFGKDNEQKENKEKTLESNRSNPTRHGGSSDNPSPDPRQA